MLSVTTPPPVTLDASTISPSALNRDDIPTSQTEETTEKKKKKKKRAREDDQTPPDTTEFIAERGESQKKRKRGETKFVAYKAPLHVATEVNMPEVIMPDMPSESAAPKFVAYKAPLHVAIEVNMPDIPLEPVAPVATDPKTKPKKKKKKDKGKTKDAKLAEQTDAQIEADSQASAAALLSAIVAASVTNHEIPQMAPSQFDPHLLPHQFMSYPPMQYGYPPGPFDPHGAPNGFAPPGAGGSTAFSELAFGSNEDLLRALQDLDMSKIASVLKTLGEAASANGPTFAPQLGFMPSQLDQLPPAPPVKQVAAASNSILGIPPTATSTSHRRTINMNLSGNDQHANPDHAHLLANKWLNASKLAELVRDEGLVYKKGKFSAIEEEQLRLAIERYQHEKGLSQDQLVETVFSKNDKSKDTAFWSELTAAVPLRPIIAVYHHIRRSYHPLKQQGRWAPHEDDALKQAVADLGQQWEKVSYRVGRMASDCRDRYRNHIVNRDIRVTGHWSTEEEEKLTRIVTDMTIKQGKDIDNDVFWGRVSELMGGSRGRQQCRIKWTDALSKTVKNEGRKPRWSQQDAFILVHKIDSLHVRDDTEIDWKLISDPDWNLWSAHTLQRRWLTLKKGVKGYEDMTHQEIMDILRIKKAHLPPPTTTVTRKKKERKVTSAAAVDDADVPGDNGSSNGPGTPSAAQSRGTSSDEDSDETDSDS